VQSQSGRGRGCRVKGQRSKFEVWSPGHFGFGVWGLGFGFGVWDLGLGASGMRLGVWGLGLGAWGFGFWAWGLGFGIKNLG
jgi:hypothetical protein